jgi:hypothetical protein
VQRTDYPVNVRSNLETHGYTFTKTSRPPIAKRSSFGSSVDDLEKGQGCRISTANRGGVAYGYRDTTSKVPFCRA